MTYYPAQRDFDVWDWAEQQVADLWPEPGDPDDLMSMFEITGHSRVTLDFVLSTPALRAELCREDPLLFAWVYLRRHLTAQDGTVSFAAPHLEWAELARDWIKPPSGIASWRHAFVAPRETGKSTWWFLAIPLWSLAYNHAGFVAAFANSTGQAEQHLATLKHELDTNVDLRNDFPELCAPARRSTGTQIADRQGMLHCRSGAVFAAKGVDAASLGMKVGDRRPDVLVLDDLEPDEARYSKALAEKRLGTLRDAILPLNIRARVALVGTVTMPESVIHQIVKHGHGVREPENEWVGEEGIVSHHQLPIIDDGQGHEVSAWPQKWPLEWLQERRHTREFAKNYLNDPLARSGAFWRLDNFVWEPLPNLTHQVLSIDPALSDKSKSDYTGLAVIGYSSVTGKCVVRHAQAVKIPPGEGLRGLVMKLINEFPDTQGVLVEVNQGGSHIWRGILHDLPVTVKTIHQSEHKETRAGWLLTQYERRRVVHEQRFPALEGQMVSFPRGLNDDLVDAVGTGVRVFLGKKKSASASSAAYV